MAQVPHQYREIMVDRLETAAAQVPLTVPQWGRLLELLFPEDFRDGGHDVEPTDADPGSEVKIDVLHERFLRRLNLFHPGDRLIDAELLAAGAVQEDEDADD